MSDINKLGLGVMIGMLGGNVETVEAVKASMGKVIAAAACEDDRLRIRFADGSTLTLRDDGQSCCEHRYMVCDDDLSTFAGATITNISLKEAPNLPDGEVHEVQFLEVETDRGAFQCATHNEHNGYYGGFWIVATMTPA